ncbi:MAG: PAS domain-containing protein, partial [Gammaproteobacteria bacterium]
MARGRTGLLPGLCAGPDPDGTLETLLGADGACVVREALQAAADHGSDAGKVLRLPGGDGARWLELGVTRLPARASGDAACYLLVARDVSARETSARRAIAAREALAVQSREDEYRAAIETSTDGYWAVDPSGRILDVNEAYCRLSGFAREEVVGHSSLEFDALADPADAPARVEQFRLAGRQRVETLHRARDGRLWPVEVNVTYSPVGGGRIFAFIKDQSAARRAEAELRRLWLAVEQTSNAVLITDLEGNIDYVNRAFCETTGYGREEVAARNARMLGSGRTPEASWQEMWGRIGQGLSWSGEWFNRRKDGQEYVASARVTPLREADGSITRYLAVQDDITERK